MFIYLPFQGVIFVCLFALFFFFFNETLKKVCMYVCIHFLCGMCENRCICPLDFLKPLNMLVFLNLDFLDF